MTTYKRVEQRDSDADKLITSIDSAFGDNRSKTRTSISCGTSYFSYALRDSALTCGAQ